MKQLLRGFLTTAAAATLYLACTHASQAVPVTWILQNYDFQDGGTATGSFTYDRDSNAFSNVNINTSYNALTKMGRNYQKATGDAGNIFLETNIPQIGPSYFGFYLDVLMTNAGGLIKNSDQYGYNESSCTELDCRKFETRLYTRPVSAFIVSSAVPLPAALPLMASALGALGMIGWPRKRRFASVA